MAVQTSNESAPPSALGTTGVRILSHLKRFTWGHVIFLSALVGVVSGLGGIAFNFMVDTADRYAMAEAAGYVPPGVGAEGGGHAIRMPARRWVLVVAPALGGLLAGLLVFTLAPEAEGHGTDAVIKSFHHGRGVIRTRVPLIKAVASAITIGSGGSAGREGPIAQIGAGFGSALGGWLRVGERERRLLMLAGGGAGIGAVFRAPLGGALFMAEVLYREMDFESSALVPAFVAAIIGFSIYCFIYGSWGAIFKTPALQFNHPLELPLYVLLGALCAGVGWVYVKFFYAMRDFFARLRGIPRHVKPMIGGLLVGTVGFFFPQALGMGYGWTQLAIDGALSMKILALLVFVKIGLTGLTIGSGGSGGVFGPSIVIGGCLGALYGTLMHRLMPGVVTQPAAFALVGMAGFFAGVAKAPISSLVMVSEMTEGYGLLVPLMLTTAVAYMLLPRRVSIYEEQLPTRASSPAHEGEFTLDVLEAIRVAEVLKKDSPPVVFSPQTPLPDVLLATINTRQKVFPIISLNGEGLVGVVILDDLRIFLTERGIPPELLVANDLRAMEFRTVTPQEDLAAALRKLNATGLDELPVVQDDDSRHVIAMLSRRDIMAAYHRRMYEKE
jgi:CIC family chloride channel protein